MDKEICKNCIHYFRHYTLNTRRILQVYCGHCALSRVKTKRPDSMACEHFVLASDPKEAFVTKEYLSKQLLQYMQSLELLPTIEEE